MSEKNTNREARTVQPAKEKLEEKQLEKVSGGLLAMLYDEEMRDFKARDMGQDGYSVRPR